jgi:DNA repair exonuclease SbcCD ATPase subunit
VTNVGSERIRILEEQIRDQRVLLEQAEREFQQETTGLKVHLQAQAATLQTILGHLEQRLRPLQEYIAKEEANLNNLVEDMTRRPEDFVAENFAGYISTQKASIDLTRKSIEEQRNPFIEYFEEQMEALELSLKRFDPFIQRLAANLDEQQEILEGFLGAMRDDHFQAVRGYLDERADTWKQFATSGDTDPTDTYRRLRHLRDGFARLAQGQQNLSDLLAHTTRADDHIGDLVRPQGRTDTPIPMPIRDEARPATEAVPAAPEE